MLQVIKQFMYFADNSEENLNVNTSVDLSDELQNVFINKIITQVSVQSLPGIRFYINNNADPVIVGPSGLFQIDLTAGGSITNLYFNENDLQLISKNDSAYLIVNIAYIGG